MKILVVLFWALLGTSRIIYMDINFIIFRIIFSSLVGMKWFLAVFYICVSLATKRSYTANARQGTAPGRGDWSLWSSVSYEQSPWV